MNPAERHVDLLATFHYVVGGILVFFSFVPLLYFTFIWRLLSNPEIMRGEHPPPPFLGTILLAAGFLFAVMGWIYASLIIMAGRFLQKRKHRTYCLVAAALACLFQPFGTILGVFTIVILMRSDAAALFDSRPPMQPPPLPVSPA